MVKLPDPDSEAMGHLVDTWLVSLRQAGMSSRTLERKARRLAWEFNHNQQDNAVIVAFREWVNKRAVSDSTP